MRLMTIRRIGQLVEAEPSQHRTEDAIELLLHHNVMPGLIARKADALKTDVCIDRRSTVLSLHVNYGRIAAVNRARGWTNPKNVIRLPSRTRSLLETARIQSSKTPKTISGS